jgi:hypothetical protein
MTGTRRLDGRQRRIGQVRKEGLHDKKLKADSPITWIEAMKERTTPIDRWKTVRNRPASEIWKQFKMLGLNQIELPWKIDATFQDRTPCRGQLHHGSHSDSRSNLKKVYFSTACIDLSHK